MSTLQTRRIIAFAGFFLVLSLAWFSQTGLGQNAKPGKANPGKTVPGQPKGGAGPADAPNAGKGAKGNPNVPNPVGQGAPGAPGLLKKITMPEPQDSLLETKDGWGIKATYFPGGVYVKKGEKGKEEFAEKPGKSVIPIVLVHGYKGQRSDYKKLAIRLQQLGHAVVVPDLRGHGQSKTRISVNGRTEEVDAEKMKPADFQNMYLDLVAVKKALVRENNAEKLNVEQLVVVGADMGALVAMNWAVYDWARPSLPSVKLGQDVKAMILLSPSQGFKGMTATSAFASAPVRAELAVMLAVGSETSKVLAESKSIYKKFEKYHPHVEDVAEEARSLLMIEVPTTLQGTEFWKATTRLNVEDEIIKFIDRQIGKNADRLEWSKRENPVTSES